MAPDDTTTLRIAPAVRAQLDQLRPDVFGIPALAIPDLIGDKVMLLSKQVHDARVRAWAAGKVLGPLQYEHEETADAWTFRVTAELRPRGTVDG